MKRLATIAALLMLCGQGTLAAISFSVTADRTKAALGEQITITGKVVSDQQLGNPPQPALSETENFSILRTSRNQNQSSSVQIVNGRMTQSVEITYLFYYFIAPKQVGTFTFPSLEFSHGGASYTSQPFEITITKEPVTNPNISVTVSLSKSRLYVGEQTVLTFEVAHKPRAPVNFVDHAWMDAIGKIEEALGKDFAISRLFGSRLGQTQKQIGGEPYLAYQLRFSIVPLRSGTFSAGRIPYEYQELHRKAQRRNDPFFDGFFGDFFGGGVQAVAKTVVSNAVRIEVTQLPTPPPDFCGAVGPVQLQASVDPLQVPAGEAVTLKVAVKSKSRPGSLGDLVLPSLTGFEVFTPEKHTSVDTAETGLTTRRTYKYLLIPRQEGQATVPAISVSYFDPSSRSYKQAASGPFELTITKGKAVSASQARYLTKEEIREVGHDIRYIKTPSKIIAYRTMPHRRPVFLFLFPLPFIAILLAGLYRVQMTRREQSRSRAQRNRAMGVALRTLARVARTQADPAQIAGLTADAILTYITDRFGIAAVGMVLEDVEARLTMHGVLPEAAAQARTLLEELDNCRFGGTSVDSEAVVKYADRARDTVRALVKAPRGGRS